MSIDTHNLRIQTGRHAGELFTRLPISYLKWMVNIGHSDATIAKAELDRRGTVTPTLDLSGHAIDRVSINCLDIYRRDREQDEGLHSWLIRACLEAIEENDKDKKGRYRYKGMMIVIETDLAWPVVKTVMRQKNTD